MALNKKKKWVPCTIHCAIYTLCILLFLIPEFLGLNILLILFLIAGIFLSHLVLDKTSLINKWLKLIGGRSYEETFKFTKDKSKLDIEKQFFVSYTALVHTVADNTLHLLILYILFNLVILL